MACHIFRNIGSIRRRQGSNIDRAVLTLSVVTCLCLVLSSCLPAALFVLFCVCCARGLCRGAGSPHAVFSRCGSIRTAPATFEQGPRSVFNRRSWSGASSAGGGAVCRANRGIMRFFWLGDSDRVAVVGLKMLVLRLNKNTSETKNKSGWRRGD